MKLAKSAHTSQPWRIHELAPDFELEDVWSLPTPGGTGDFPQLLDLIASGSLGAGSRLSRILFAIRWKIGKILGWDDTIDGVDTRVPSLRDRLPSDLRDAPRGSKLAGLPFSPIYRTENEWAAEIANRTVHAIVHLGWVVDDSQGGTHRGQMAVLVKPNGVLGRCYLAAIKPFRLLIVYPRMIEGIGKGWRS